MGGPRTLTRAPYIDLLRRLCAANTPNHETADILGMSEQGVIDARRRLGLRPGDPSPCGPGPRFGQRRQAAFERRMRPVPPDSLDAIACGEADTPLDTILAAEEADRIEAAIRRLAPRQQVILRLRLEGRTLGEVAAHVRLTRERVRQIEANARRRLERAGIVLPAPRPWSAKWLA